MSAKVEIDSKILASKAIVCDIEGTTTSISFVKDVLFPYAKEHVETFLKENFGNDDVKAVVAQLREQAIEDVKSEIEGAIAIAEDNAEEAEQIASIVKNVEWQMSNDRKNGALKTLQGLIYPKGYKDGTIKAHVYEDVPKAFEQWVSTGHKIYIYSSGSVEAQKLLFAHTEHGDLSAHIAGYFDTAIGAKQESKSYAAIANDIKFISEEIVFLTDIVKEAEAAKETGMNVILLARPGNADYSDDEKAQYVIVESFADIPFATVGGIKRKIDEVATEPQEVIPTKMSKADTPEESAETNKNDVDKKNDIEEKMEVDSTEIKPAEDKEAAKSVSQKTETKEKTDGITTENETVKDKEIDNTIKETEMETDGASKPAVESGDLIKQNVDEIVEKKDTESNKMDIKETEPQVVEKMETASSTEVNSDIITDVKEKEAEPETAINTEHEKSEKKLEIESTEKTIPEEEKKAESENIKTEVDSNSLDKQVDTTTESKVDESSEVVESTTEVKPIEIVEKKSSEENNKNETVDSKDNKIESSELVKPENETESVEKVNEVVKSVTEQNGHTNGNTESNGHTENGTTVNPENTEKKTELASDEIKTKKILDVDQEATPPVETTEA